MRRSLSSIICFLAFLLLTPTLYSQKKIDYSAVTLEYAKSIAPDAWRLIGNVVFIDRAARMYCDSAYFYQNTQNIDAFGHIRIVPDNRGNTSLVGQVLHYTAADRIANIQGNVVLVDDSATLTTQTIFYSMNTGIANYPVPGTIVQGKTVINSELGAYNKYTKEANFKRKVVVTNPQGIIHTDTMNYNTASKKVYFVGPTIINSNNKDTIYCERGWYNMDSGISSYCQNAWIKGGGSTVKGDTLYYEKFTGLGKAFGNVEMRDSSQNYILRGNYVNYSRPQKTGFASKKALMIQVDNKDSLYLHGDTIYYGYYTRLKDSTSHVQDTFKYVKAYHHVKFFRKDLQGKCDSMYYSFQDSTLQFIGSPILWAQGNQLTAEHMKIYIKNKEMERLELNTSSLIINQNEDTSKYNQIRGRNMTGYFSKNALKQMYVKGNGEMIYFHRDKGDIVGIQKTESSDIKLFFKKNKKERNELSKISYINDIKGTYNPPLSIQGNDLLLKDFIWLDKLRPKVWSDVFVWQ